MRAGNETESESFQQSNTNTQDMIANFTNADLTSEDMFGVDPEGSLQQMFSYGKPVSRKQVKFDLHN